jgi:hypothetical protein
MTDEFDITTIDVGSSSTIAQLFKLPQQMIDYLWERIDIAKKNQVCVKDTLAGNISHSYNLEDPRDLVVQKLYNIVHNSVDNPKMFEFISMELENIYRRSVLENGRLEPYLTKLWVNFQKKGEFQPVHAHKGVFSFVIWMDIPYHSKDEGNIPIAKTSDKNHRGGNFSFVSASGITRSVSEYTIELSPEMNGCCCFFPSDLSHQVYPFYTSDKDRISISGNIAYRSISKPNPPPVYQFPFHMSET